ncbi:MAG: hypothetical protein RQ751_13540 [Longimicrobiales bacterium]|nr:hypothetical protein [Longimicrobiales bacterium]
MRPLRIFAPLGAAVLTLGTISCGAGSTASSPAVLPMRQHWEAANVLQRAMVTGDLPIARRAAGRIAEVEQIPGLPADAGPYLNRMRDEARAVAAASTFPHAAEAAGRMAAACGACHVRGSYGPRPEGGTRAPTVGSEGTQYHMLLHTWAVDRMWEGLIVPSTERWQAGARVLAEQSVSAEGFSPEVALMAARMHDAGRQAMEVEDASGRADHFGSILKECASCHAELKLRGERFE